MTTNLIIGAGQLGSRHLQGLLKAPFAQTVYVMDPSAASLETAAARAAEVNHQATLHWVSSWQELPAQFDLVIVATGANVRAAVTEQLLAHHQVKYLVLEKVLFQDIESYTRIAGILAATCTPAWVNHPRRMYAHYREIRSLIAADPGPLVFTATGTQWGLACNALHLVDLCCFFTGAAVTELDFDWTDPVIHPSKRTGYIEFTGTVKGRLADQSLFTLSSLPGEPGPLTLQVSTAKRRWLIQEGARPSLVGYTAADGFARGTQQDLEPYFQSGLSTLLAAELLQTGNCELPTYKEACAAHLPFITAALKRFEVLSGQPATIIPIT